MSWREPPLEAGPPQGVLVLGMHRSGTSATTRALNLLGLATCDESDLLHDRRGNAKGHWESVSMVAANASLLDEMGRAWWCPPRPGDDYWPDADRVTRSAEDLASVFDTVHPTVPWVWKDPRTSVTLPIWRHALRRPMAAVVTVRNPMEVADSLTERNALSPQLGVAIWARSTRLLLSHLAGLPVFVGRYDDLLADPFRWCDQVVVFLDSIGLERGPADRSAVEEFVTGELRHSSRTVTDVAVEFPTVTPLVEALDLAQGPWRSFPDVSLSPEPTWIETDFTAVGSWQTHPLPPRSALMRSVVILATGADWEPIAKQLGASLPQFTEGLVVVDVEPTDEQLREVPDRVTVVVVPAGTRAGAARMAGAAQAGGQILDFRTAALTVPAKWGSELTRGLSAGFAAVAPAIRGRNGGVGFGLRWKSPAMQTGWGGRPSSSLVGVPLLPDACFAISREVFDAVGGFDPELGAYGLDTFELSVRLNRLGYRCGVVRDVVAALTGPPAADPVDWAAYSSDLLRLARRHVDVTSLEPVVASVLAREGAAAVVTAALATDITGGHASALDERPRVTWHGPVEPAPTFTALASLGVGRRSAPSVSVLVTTDDPPLAGGFPLPAKGFSGDVEVLLGSSRASLGEAASGDLLAFVDGGTAQQSGWLSPLVAELVRGSAGAVGPMTELTSGVSRRVVGLTPGAGLDDLRLALGDEDSPEATGVTEVFALLDHCVVIRRSTYDEVGGFGSLPDPTLATVELCLRLWRHELPVVAVSSAVVGRSRRIWPRDAAGSDRYLASVLSIGALHLDEESHVELLERTRTLRGFAEAVGRIATAGVVRRRDEISRGATLGATEVLHRWQTSVAVRPAGPVVAGPA